MANKLEQAIGFVLELDKLKAVERKIKPLGLDRYENSAEHSWQLALFAMALAEYADAPIDVDRVVRMLLVHDVGEIDTGDTMAFVEGGWEERKAAELLAVKRILGMLPTPLSDELVALWQEFELGETADARFAGAVDRAMPVLLNLNNDGQSWRDHGISHARVVKRIQPQIQAGCPALWTYLQARLRAAHEGGWFGIAAE
jgi:putative hydrolases of HD superfamily